MRSMLIQRRRTDWLKFPKAFCQNQNQIETEINAETKTNAQIPSARICKQTAISTDQKAK
jgi:hypothetical protein